MRPVLKELDLRNTPWTWRTMGGLDTLEPGNPLLCHQGQGPITEGKAGGVIPSVMGHTRNGRGGVIWQLGVDYCALFDLY